VVIGTGTDVTMSLGYVILMKSDLEHILYALKLGSYSLKKIKQNLESLRPNLIKNTKIY
jgi:cation transport ATPase